LAQGSAEQYVDPFASLKSRCKEFIGIMKFSSHHRQTRSAKRGRKRKALILRERFVVALCLCLFQKSSFRVARARVWNWLRYCFRSRWKRIQKNSIDQYFCHHCQSANSSKDYIFFLIGVRERNVANPRRAFGVQIFQHLQMPVTSGTSHRPLVPRRVRYFVKIL